jgi:hypothetical protein
VFGSGENGVDPAVERVDNKSVGPVTPVGFLVVAARGLLLFHHAAGLVARGSECFAGFRVSKICGEFIQHAACRNDIAVAVTFRNIPKGLHRLFKGLFVT